MTIRIKSEIAGKVWKIEAKPGDILAEDDPILILESMKMEIPIAAPSRCKPFVPILATALAARWQKWAGTPLFSAMVIPTRG